MPAKDGLRLNDMRRTEQARPEPGQPYHQGPVTAAQPKARRRTPQGDAELMAKEQVLDFKSPRRLEEVYNEHCERMQEREHRSRSCADSTRRGDSQAGWNFRKAQVLRAPTQEALQIVVNAPNERLRFRYLHMLPKQFNADGIVSGRLVREGEVIGKVGNFFRR